MKVPERLYTGKSHILNMDTGSLLTRRFRRIRLSVIRYRLTKTGFARLKGIRAFLESPGNVSSP